MGPPSYMRSVVDRNVVMRRMTVFKLVTVVSGQIKAFCTWQHLILGLEMEVAFSSETMVLMYHEESRSERRWPPFYNFFPLSLESVECNKDLCTGTYANTQPVSFRAVSMGSAVALFFGASLLTFVEIICYLTLRSCRRQPDKKKTSLQTVMSRRRRARVLILQQRIHHLRGAHFKRHW